MSMSDNVYKLLELTGSSSVSIEDAVETAISKASKSVHNMRWVEITNTRGYIDNNKLAAWQVTMKIGFTLE
jgi:hypothetical protein